MLVHGTYYIITDIRMSMPPLLPHILHTKIVTFVIFPATTEQHGERNFIRTVISFRRLMLKRPFYRAFATRSPPEFPCRTFRTRDPPMPRRVSSAQASSAESCWLHDVRTLATRDLSNETSRERFTCVVAYSFVWRDSRTSVTLCTPHRPNCMLTSLQCRLLSFC